MLKKLEKAMFDLKNSDDSALAIIYQIMSKGVFTFVLPILNDYQLAEDITQQTFITIYEKKNQYELNTNARNWILTIAKNLALNELKKHKNETTIKSEETSNNFQSYEMKLEFDTPTIDLAKQILDISEFQILMMYLVVEYKHKEIANILNLPLGTVTWKYKNALDKLRKALKGKEVL